MHLLAWLALILALAACAACFVGIDTRAKVRALPGRSQHELTAAWKIAVGAGALALLMGASLLVAQPSVCRVLGGEWIVSEASCRHEFGGNGNNDVGKSWAPFTL